MKCPKCSGDVRTIRTDPSPDGTRRRRECTNEACLYRWTTLETAITELPVSVDSHVTRRGPWEAVYGPNREDGRQPRRRADSDAIQAALNVDARKHEMREAELRRLRRLRAGGEYNESRFDDGFDHAPRRLTRRQLMAEVMSTDSPYLQGEEPTDE